MHLPTLRDNLYAWWQHTRLHLAGQWRQAVERVGLAPHTAEPAVDEGFLPDFCSTPVLVNVVLIAQLFALVTTLVAHRITFIMEDLVLISLFIQWIALTSVGVLCYARRYLNQL